MKKIIIAVVVFSLSLSGFGVRAHEMDRSERDSGKYITKVKVRDYYDIEKTNSDREYNRSTITFKYDGQVYTVPFEKFFEKKTLVKVDKKYVWVPNPAKWIN